MTLYIVLFALLCITTAIELGQKQERSVVGIRTVSMHTTALIPLLLFVFLGVFREVTVGFDAQTYYNNYWLKTDSYTWKYLFTNFSIDNGFALLLKVLSLFTDNWWFARALLFLLTFLLYYKVIAKETPYPSMSLIIFLGLNMLGLMFGILRQALAGAVSLIAYNQLRKGSWCKCLLLILIACTIHKTALLCVFMLVLHLLRMKKLSGIKLIAFSLLSYGVIFLAIPIITRLYAGSRYYGIAGSNGGYGMLLFIIAILLLLGYLMRITDAYKDNELIYLFNLSCGAFFIQVGALQWSLLNRTTVFFSIYWCILIPKLIARLPQRKRWICYFAVIVLFGFMFFYQLTDVELFVMHKF